MNKLKLTGGGELGIKMTTLIDTRDRTPTEGRTCPQQFLANRNTLHHSRMKQHQSRTDRIALTRQGSPPPSRLLQREAERGGVSCRQQLRVSLCSVRAGVASRRVSQCL